MNKRNLVVLAFTLFVFLSVIYFSFDFVSFRSLLSQVAVPESNTLQTAEVNGGNPDLSKTQESGGEVSLIAVGDIMLSRGVAQKINRFGSYYPFEKMRDYLNQADIVFGNLEAPIAYGRKVKDFEMTFRIDPGLETVLRDVGFSMLSLANNHSPNLGTQALETTFDYLNQAGIKYSGAGRNSFEAYSPTYLKVKGKTFAFLAYLDPKIAAKSYEARAFHPGVAVMDADILTLAVKQAKEKSDFVIVSMHAGDEYTEKLTDLQINFAHKAVDAGADLVLGHHPHVVQKMEKYKGKYIFYSLGNFIFDQMWSENTRRGLVVKAFFGQLDITKIELLPVLIKDYSQPWPMRETDGSWGVIERLRFSGIERKGESGYILSNN